LRRCEVQKRTIDVVYTPEELAKARESPFGATNGDLSAASNSNSKSIGKIDRYLPRGQD